MTDREAIPNYMREKVLARDGHKCRYCGVGVTHDNHHMDHVYPISKGGETSEANLVTSCGRCNLKKHNKIGKWPLPLEKDTSPGERKMLLEENLEDAWTEYNTELRPWLVGFFSFFFHSIALVYWMENAESMGWSIFYATFFALDQLAMIAVAIKVQVIKRDWKEEEKGYTRLLKRLEARNAETA